MFLSLFMFTLCRDRTYIDRSSSYQFEFESGPHLYQSVISLSYQFVFLGLHLYRSVIVLSIRVRGRTYIDRPSSCHISLCFWDRTYIDRSLSCQLEFGAAPISIGHHHVSSISRTPHLYRSVIVLSVRVRGRTYIDRPSPCHISLCLWDRTYIDRSFSVSVRVFGAAHALERKTVQHMHWRENEQQQKGKGCDRKKEGGGKK